MVVAGERADDRREAHSRWAERYAKAGKVRKALAHFGRALDFGTGSGVFADDEASRYGCQPAFDGVKDEFDAARDRSGRVGGIRLNNLWYRKSNGKYLVGMSVQSDGVLLTSGSEKAEEAEIIEVQNPAGSEHWLLAIGKALDECATKLLLSHESRVFLQGEIMQKAFVSYIGYLRRLAARYESSEQERYASKRRLDDDYQARLHDAYQGKMR